MSEKISPSQKQDVIMVKDRKVSCDGPEGGHHPNVYLTIEKGETTVTCPYCSRVFKLKS